MKLSAEMLRESEWRFRSLLEHISDVVVLLDPSGTIRYITPSIEQVCGYPRSEMVGRAVWDFVHPEDVDLLRARVSSRLRGEGDPERDTEIRVRRRDGSWRVLQLRGRFFRDGKGEPAVLVSVRDVTEQKAAEARLAHRLQLDRALAEVSSILLRAGQADLAETLRILGVAVGVRRAYLFVLHEGECLPDNAHEWRAAGVEQEADVLRTVSDELFPLWMERLRRGETIAIRDAASLPRDSTSEREILEARGIHSPLVMPLATKNGELLGFIGFDHPGRRHAWAEEDMRTLQVAAGMISAELERRGAEESLRESERRFRSLIENASDTVAILDRAGVIRYQSPSVRRMLGYEVAELEGASAFAFVHPEDRPAVAAAFQDLIQESGAVRAVEFRFLHKDRSWRRLEAMGRNLLTDPAVAGLVVNTRDVTAAWALEDRLRRSERLKAVGQLAGGVAHDFNNILTTIIGHTQLVLEHTAVNSLLRADLLEIERAGARGATLTRQLLAFSRKQVLKPVVLDLNRVVSEMQSMLRRLIGEDIELTTDLSPTLGRTRADRGQLEQVIMNLAVNARDAMPEGGRLTIETDDAEIDAVLAGQYAYEVRTGPYVRLRISDTGLGIDAAILSQIFEPFFTTKAEGRGTGLGLATVFGIVKQSGGYIWVETEVGKGTRFEIYLPRVDADLGEGAVNGSESAERGAGETIMIVEDDPAVRSLARRVLVQIGYRVLAAVDGEEALDIVDRFEGSIDLVITDVVMPRMGGAKLAEKLERLRPGFRVLFMSGYTDDAIAHHGVLEPGMAFIEKPFTPRALAAKVRELLANAARG